MCICKSSLCSSFSTYLDSFIVRLVAKSRVLQCHDSPLRPKLFYLGVFHRLDSIPFVVTLPSRSSHMSPFYHELLVRRLVGKQHFPPLRNRPVSMTFRKLRFLLFHDRRQPRFLCRFLGQKAKFLVQSPRKTVLMLTSVPLESRIARTFLQELIGKRTTTRCIVLSSLTEVLRSHPLFFRS